MIISLTYYTSVIVAYLNFVLVSQTEKLMSGVDTPATQYNWTAALLYVFFSLFNALFLSFIFFRQGFFRNTADVVILVNTRT